MEDPKQPELTPQEPVAADALVAMLRALSTEVLDAVESTASKADIRQIAVSRLLLDNFAHIKSYWQMVTPKMAQISLRFGADDIDGTVVEEKIYHDAGATTPQGLRRRDLERLITEAGRIPFD